MPFLGDTNKQYLLAPKINKVPLTNWQRQAATHDQL
jgi:hypothetical protein